MLFQREVRIIQNKRVKGYFYACILLAPEIARISAPGQFINVRVSSKPALLLRRPFSIHSVLKNKIKIIYQVLGEGTRLLSGKKTGEYLDIIGPLGSGFEYKTRRSGLLVAGGMGVAPLVFLAEKLKGIKNTVLVGARSAAQILCEKEFRKSGFDVKIATDDGSRGFKGRVTELLREVLATNCTSQGTRKKPSQFGAFDMHPSTIYACGPHPMLEETAIIAQRYNIPAQVSLEEHMACGVGACLGCVVTTRLGLKRVCKEGPVFKAEEIAW